MKSIEVVEGELEIGLADAGFGFSPLVSFCPMVVEGKERRVDGTTELELGISEVAGLV